MKSKEIKNNESISIYEIPVLKYDDFYNHILLLFKKTEIHCLSYFAYFKEDFLTFICCLANDEEKNISILSHEMPKSNLQSLASLTLKIPALHIFEREIAENFGIKFENHPWLKPVRYSFEREDRNKTMNNYPFFKIEGNDTHEVGVGPIHAGIIEPGHFRFSCHGEIVHHLEIQLGYQHRGIEKLYLSKPHLLQQTILSENISGDSAIAHNLAFVNMMETLYNTEKNVSWIKIDLYRSLALELERIAIHVGDLSNMCLDVAYQLGNAVFGALRTPVINFLQLWCGNRFGKGLLRVGYNPHPFTKELYEKLVIILEEFDLKYMEMQHRTFSLPSVLNRFQKCGQLSKMQMQTIGAVGMSARMAGVERDIRQSHPFNYFQHIAYEPVILENGDVYARAMMRNMEIQKSMSYIRVMLTQIYRLNVEEPQKYNPEIYTKKMNPNQISISLTEGWRGEICHVGITNEEGNLLHYKIKDPSMHNWTALALALRENEISDFPINNKSFNLSYCGHDL
ncbi:MAG: NADH dehydrogenase subunit [Cytophagales bacterium]|nr:MAG: NADH dehydrogenase subunit [Cytophagales bacterium]